MRLLSPLCPAMHHHLSRFPGGLKIAASLGLRRGKRTSAANVGVTRTSADTTATDETPAEAEAHQKVVAI